MKKQRASSRLPDSAVPADPSQQVPWNSWSPPPLYYVDEHYVCCDCGEKQLWTANQQKWYYEVAKGSLYARAVRCLDFRRKRAALYAHGDPHPVKHLGTLMKRILKEVSPVLTAAGFRLDQKIASSFTNTGLLEFSRPDEIVVVSYQRPDGNPQLVAESVSDNGGYALLAYIELNPKVDVLEKIADIKFAIEQRFQ